MNFIKMNFARLLTKTLKGSMFALLIGLFSLNCFANQSKSINTKQDGTKAHPFELGWSDLMPDDFTPDKLAKKFEKELKRLDSLSDESEEGLAIIQKIQLEIDKIPSNPKWDGKWVKLPGFIAPLETRNAQVVRFLLVPYFGACIHVPPPPVNQTVLVDVKKKHGIKLNQIDLPFIITGKLSLDKTNTEIGNAGYHITNAKAEVNHDSSWLEEE
jgi:hypothetical protein